MKQMSGVSVPRASRLMWLTKSDRDQGFPEHFGREGWSKDLESWTIYPILVKGKIHHTLRNATLRKNNKS